jgi:hypothetical protein
LLDTRGVESLGESLTSGSAGCVPDPVDIVRKHILKLAVWASSLEPRTVGFRLRSDETAEAEFNPEDNPEEWKFRHLQLRRSYRVAVAIRYPGPIGQIIQELDPAATTLQG